MDRLVRSHMLGVSDLLAKRKSNPRYRPKTVDAPLRRDKIVQMILYAEATNPTWQRKKIVADVGEALGVSRAHIFNALKRVDPERREHIKCAARALAECGYTIEFSKRRLK